jgi:hypothetical protein
LTHKYLYLRNIKISSDFKTPCHPRHIGGAIARTSARFFDGDEPATACRVHRPKRHPPTAPRVAQQLLSQRANTAGTVQFLPEIVLNRFDPAPFLLVNRAPTATTWLAALVRTASRELLPRLTAITVAAARSDRSPWRTAALER